MVTSQKTVPGIDADEVVVGENVRIGTGTRIFGRSVHLGDGVSIGDDVTISCDELRLDAEVRIANRCTFVSPQIRIGERSRIGIGGWAELNEYFVLGRLCDVGQSVRVVGQGLHAGDYLWVTDHVTVGGGGARGPRSYLRIGDRAAIMDHCLINLSQEVSIGSDTALSNGVTVLTHSLWQPILAGGTTTFAPVSIGDDCIVYVNAIVAPGVTIGRHVTIGAGALVLQDVPDASTALGNPARIIKSTPTMPRELSHERQDTILRDILRSWVSSLAVKGVAAKYDDNDSVTATIGGVHEVVSYMSRASTASTAPASPATSISLAFAQPPSDLSPRCHFDLSARSVRGEPGLLGEDLRDHLRRHTIRIYSDRPFEALPPAHIDRLRARLRSPR